MKNRYTVFEVWRTGIHTDNGKFFVHPVKHNGFKLILVLLQEGARNRSSAVGSMSHHGNDNSDNAENSMDMENQALSRKSTKEQESKEFETQDYRSYDPSPSIRQPPHKLTPNGWRVGT